MTDSRSRWIRRVVFALWIAFGLSLVWCALKAEPHAPFDQEEDSTHG